MTGEELSAEETAEAGRTMLALVRAVHDHDDGARNTLLQDATGRELRALAGTFSGALYEALVRYACALAAVEDTQLRDEIAVADIDAMGADPEMHVAIDAVLAQVHSDLIRRALTRTEGFPPRADA